VRNTSPSPLNLIGPQLRKLRLARKLTQEQLAARAAANGWDVSRITIAKIEARLRYVSDVEVVFFATLLKVSYAALLPTSSKGAFAPSYDRRNAHHLKAR
jgi:transcriptional regulator with XRE-family HTH domain